MAKKSLPIYLDSTIPEAPRYYIRHPHTAGYAIIDHVTVGNVDAYRVPLTDGCHLHPYNTHGLKSAIVDAITWGITGKSLPNADYLRNVGHIPYEY